MDFQVPTIASASNMQLLEAMLSCFLQSKDRFKTENLPEGGCCIVAPPKVLREIRRSHLYYPHKWRHHVARYHELLSASRDNEVDNSVLPLDWKKWHIALCAEALAVHGTLPPTDGVSISALCGLCHDVNTQSAKKKKQKQNTKTKSRVLKEICKLCGYDPKEGKCICFTVNKDTNKLTWLFSLSFQHKCLSTKIFSLSIL
jgi:hypothetical protein